MVGYHHFSMISGLSLEVMALRLGMGTGPGEAGLPEGTE